MKFISGLAIAVAVVSTVFASGTASSDHVEGMLRSMSLNEMIGQMTQLDISTIITSDRTLNESAVREHARLKIGSYLNTPTISEIETAESASASTSTSYGFNATEWRKLITRVQEIFMAESGGHPMLYGIDSVHGAVYVQGATIFGQQINAAATFNPELVFEMGKITGQDTEAAGIPWVFSPILEIAQNPLWSRTYETFGEDPYLVSAMADAIIRGLQSNNQTAACMKHIIGYSKTATGHDRASVTISDFDLLNYFAPPFLAAIKAGAKTAMESYIAINGVPVVANTKIMRDLVRHDMQFDGLIVSDWAEIFNLHDWHHVAKDHQDAVRQAMTKTPLDMSMVPYNVSFIGMAKQVVADHPHLYERVKSSARRILQLKHDLGLYERPVPGLTSSHVVGDEGARQVALHIARESVVLLKNANQVLPLKNKAMVFLTGPSADNIGNLCGGWTIKWQGVSGNAAFPRGVSIKQGLENITGGVEHFNGLHINGSYTDGDIEKAKALARQAEFTILALGEGPYAEKPGDIDDLRLPQGQVEYARALASTNTKVIVVLVGGRPRLLGDLPEFVDAVLFAMLPGEVGGQAIAEILYGVTNPSGRLPITYPKDPANVGIPYNHPVSTRCRDKPCEMQWEFGHGLSYTAFEYRDLKLNKNIIFTGYGHDEIQVQFTVHNTGTRDGHETAMLYLTQPYREIAEPEVKQLKKFAKVFLKAGEQQRITMALTHEDWSVFDPQIGQGFKRVVEETDFIIALKPETKCEDSSIQNPLCARFSCQRNH